MIKIDSFVCNRNIDIMHCVILHPKETTRNVLIPVTEKKLPSLSVIGTLLRRSNLPEFIGSWKSGTIDLNLFAYKTGKAGTENKHELPPPHDTILLFGEAIVIATKNGDLVNFTSNDYTKFYNEIMGGFEDLGSEDTDEGEEEEDEEEEEEEEEEEVSDKEDILPEIADEEEVAPIAPKIVIKQKRVTKKLPTWFHQEELEPESYSL